MEEKFNKYFNLFYRDVYRLAFSYTLNYADSKDIVQETFIKLYKNMNKFKENTDVEIKRWLMVVVSNNCKDYLKSFWKRKVKNLAEENQSFVNYDKELLLMTVRGFRLFSFSFLIMGINIWASSFFTALNNGFVSAAISFLRTFLFQVAAVCFLPLIIGIDGVWTSVLAAETMALAVTIIFLIKEKKKYRY